MAKICIDPGHGGTDSGGSGLGRKEKNDVLDIALKIKKLLEEQGVTVIMTRTGDKEITIANRCALANKEKCDYFLSVHRDAFNDASANGSSIYTYSKASAATEKKAQTVYDAVIKASGFKSRGLKKGAANYTDFGVNRETDMPSALLELGFITNKGDNDIFDSKKDAIALAIAKALCDITGVAYKEKTVSTPAAKPISTYQPTVLDWQKAAVADGYKFPKHGIDGLWGAECEGVAKKANCYKRTIHKNPNLTKLIQQFIGVTVDGKFGGETRAAVIRYQKANGLVADGIVGTRTYKAMLGVK